MRQYFKKLTALSVAAVLALNLVGVNVYAEGSGNENSTIEATPFEEEEDVPDSEGNEVIDATSGVESDDDQTQDLVDDEVIEDKQVITGFADLDNTFFALEEKLPINELGLPELLPVYINNSEEVVYIDVIWTCDDDYENTEYEMYTFSPVWDENNYELAMDVDTVAVPFIEVSIQNMMNYDSREGNVVTPEAGDFIFNNGVIEGLSTDYLAKLSAEQKQNINLVIPESINSTAVTEIGINAFSLLNNQNIKDCKFIGLDFSKASYLKSIGDGAFQNCHINQSLILPINLETIGENAFRLGEEKIGFTGKLIIPETVTSIGAVAFSGQRGLTSVEFKGNNITELPYSVFRYCSGLSGILRIPDSVKKIGTNTFTETNITTIYLPKLSDKSSQLLFSNSFNSKKLNAIVCDKEDFETIKNWIGDTLKSKVGYEIKVKFDTGGEEDFEPITRLFNRTYDMVKNADGQWLVTNYKLPEVEGKKWRNKLTSITVITGRHIISSDTLYLFAPYEEPVITYSEHIDKTYDGQPITLTVNASHPLAKPYKEATEGDVVFKYTWHWATIGSSANVLEGFDKNVYSFSDIRDYRQTINCTVKIQGCVLLNGSKIQFYTEQYDFKIFMHQANPIVNPIYSTHIVEINGSLPEIKLSEGDTPGTITWDEGQTIKEGTHEYKWTYTPEKNSVGSYNYKTIKGSTKLFASNGDAYIVNTEDCANGSIVLDKPYGAIKGEDVTITFKPNSGYKLSSASLDDTNIFDQVLDNKYTIRNIQSNHTVNAAFTSMDINDVKEIIKNLPDIDNDISEEVKNDILDAKLHYDAVNGSTDGDIAEEAKEKMYEAISKLEQVETVITKNDNVTNKIEITDEVHLLENMETEDAEALKNNNNASLKIELVVENTEIDEEKDKVLDDILGDNIIGESFDVSVVKILKDNNGTTRKELTELKKPIQIVFEIPKDLPSIESGYVREFSIIRLHNTEDGKIISEVLKDEDSYEDSISVRSDKFSTYIIVYKDVKKDNGSQGGGSGSYSKTYTVTFDALGGSHIAAIKDIKQGKKITKPVSPRRKGYTFTGWFIDAKCTKPFDFTKDTIKADMTLYAGWKKVEETITYNVIFNTLGGNYIPNQSIEEGQKVLVPTVPSKEGYTFTGWYSDKECSQLWDFNASTIYADTVLYAGWQKVDENTNQTIISKPIEEENEVQNDENTNKVPFESEEGIYKIKLIDTVDPSIMWILEASEGQKLVLKDMPEKEGYVFKGYFTDEKCTKPWNEDETIQKDISLYAGWDKIEDNNNFNNDEQNTNKTEEEVPTKDADSTSIFIIILVIAVIIGGIVVILKKKKK